MKTCLFCGSENFDEQGTCCECNRSSETGALVGEKPAPYRRRNLFCPDYLPQLTLILIPAISMLFLGLLWLMGHFFDAFLIMDLPRLRNCYVFVLLCIGLGTLLLIYGITRYYLAKKAHIAYCEVILQDDDSDVSADIPMNHYYRYQSYATHPHFLWLLIPMVLYPLIVSFCYYASNYQYLSIMSFIRISLPDMSDTAGFRAFMYFLPILSMFCHLLDVVVSTVTVIRIKLEIRAGKALRRADFEEDAEITEESVQEDEGGQTENFDQSENFDQHEERCVVSDIPFAFEDILDYRPIPEETDLFKQLKYMDRAYEVAKEGESVAYSLPELCVAMQNSLARKGVRMENEQVMSLVSSMAAYRLITVDIPEECREAVVAAVAECFGCEPYTEYASDAWQNETDLLTKDVNGTRTESEYLQGLYHAHYDSNRICVVTLKDAFAGLSRIMPTFCAHSRIPEKVCTLTVSENYSSALPKFLYRNSENETFSTKVYMNLPKNVWCLLTAADNATAYAPVDMLVTGGVASLVLKCQKQTPYTSEEDIKPVSLTSFMTNVKAARENTYLSEDHWKKFDKLEEFLKDRIGFSFGNRLYRKMEVYTDTYLACGGDVNHAIDSVLFNVLTSVLSDYPNEALKSAEEKIGLFEFMDKTFGSDNISGCHELLRSFGIES